MIVDAIFWIARLAMGNMQNKEIITKDERMF
jgi:hypothetical protein